MKKYQMPNVKEERLESSLFIMDGTSSPQSESGNEPTTPGPIQTPRHL